MGVDMPDIHHVVHVGPLCTVKEYFQETGHAGRDGKISSAVMYIAKHRVGIQDDMRNFCLSNDILLEEIVTKINGL